MQIVVQGLPWAFTNEELIAMFSAYAPTGAEIVMGRDGRSRVSGLSSSRTPSESTDPAWHTISNGPPPTLYVLALSCIEVLQLCCDVPPAGPSGGVHLLMSY